MRHCRRVTGLLPDTPPIPYSLQALEASAIDQVWVFGLKYLGISIGLAFLWGFLLLGVSYSKGMRMIGEIPLQLCVLMAFSIFLFQPESSCTQYKMALTFVTERMTLLRGTDLRLPLSLRSRQVARRRVYPTGCDLLRLSVCRHLRL
jgi:hypothetical protein